MALLVEIFSAVLRRLIHREMYDLKFSPVLCTHRRNSSNDVGRREVQSRNEQELRLKQPPTRHH
jgi:hypothetical protein